MKLILMGFIIFFASVIFSAAYSQKSPYIPTAMALVNASKESGIENVKLTLPVPEMVYPQNGAMNIPVIPIVIFKSVIGADRLDLEVLPRHKIDV